MSRLTPEIIESLNQTIKIVGTHLGLKFDKGHLFRWPFLL